MGAHEPRSWTEARNARLRAQFPEFTVADADGVIGTDGYRAARGESVSVFSQTAMRLAAIAANSRRKP